VNYQSRSLSEGKKVSMLRSADVDPGTGQVPLLTALSDERRTRTVVSRRASSPYYEDSGRIPLASRLSYGAWKLAVIGRRSCG